MKDEFPESYTIITNKTEKCTCKGHSFNFSSNQYKDVLFNKKILRHPNKKNSI